MPGEGMIRAFEKQIGYKLPEEYVAIVLDHDGALLDPTEVTVWNPLKESHEEIGCHALLPFMETDDGCLSMWQENIRGDPFVEGVIIFGIEAGGYLFGFDYRNGGDPSVVLLHFGDMIEYGHQLLPVAASFTEFLGSLH